VGWWHGHSFSCSILSSAISAQDWPRTCVSCGYLTPKVWMELGKVLACNRSTLSFALCDMESNALVISLAD